MSWAMGSGKENGPGSVWPISRGIGAYGGWGLEKGGAHERVRGHLICY